MATNEVTVTTQSPTTYFATDSTVLGYYSNGAVVTSFYCPPDATVTTSDGRGGCCPESETACNMRQSCDGNTIVHQNGDRSTCGDATRTCSTRTLYDGEGSLGGDWSVSMIHCMVQNDVASALYWTLPGNTIYTTISTVTDSADMPRTTTITLSEGATQPTATDEPTTEEGKDEGSDTNVGAIAGGVVGGVAGLALIVAALWFYLRRKKQKDAELREIGLGYTGREGKGGSLRPNQVFEMEAESRENWGFQDIPNRG